MAPEPHTVWQQIYGNGPFSQQTFYHVTAGKSQV